MRTALSQTVLLFLPRSQLERELEETLTSERFDIRAAGSADECTRLARPEKFDGIVVHSDSLPFSDALALMTFLGNEIPQPAVFFIARYLDPDQRLRLFQTTIDGWVPEPFLLQSWLFFCDTLYVYVRQLLISLQNKQAFPALRRPRTRPGKKQSRENDRSMPK